jgi:hypothetical protein
MMDSGVRKKRQERKYLSSNITLNLEKTRFFQE